MQMHTSTDHYIQYIPKMLYVIHANTHYILIHTNTYQYQQYIPYVQYIQILINMYKYRPLRFIYNTCQYIWILWEYLLIHICTFQYRPIPINAYNTYHMYNTNKYIQICPNIDHYIQYIHIHINTCNTCQYTLIHINADEYLSMHTIHTIYTIHTNTYQYKYRPLHAINASTYKYV